MIKMIKKLINRIPLEARVYLSIGSIALAAWAASAYRPIEKLNLWRAYHFSSCHEFVNIARETTDPAKLEGNLMNKFMTCAYKLADKKVDKIHKESMKRLPKSIEEINKKLNQRASEIVFGQALLWPIEYAKEGKTYASGHITTVDLDSITWTPGNKVSVVMHRLGLTDNALGDGIEESDDTETFEANCLDDSYKKLCNRLRELIKQ